MSKFILLRKGVKAPLGIIEIDEENNLYKYVRNTEYVGPEPWFLNKDKKVTEEEALRAWVLARAPDENYAMIDYWLDKLGIKEYDALAFFKYNKGVFCTDEFYVNQFKD